MDPVFKTFAIVTSFALDTTILLNGFSEPCHVITFSSDFSKVIIPDNGGVASNAWINKTDFASSQYALMSALNRPPAIIAYNQTGATVNGLPAYSIAVEKWTNAYALEIGDIVIFEGRTNNVPWQNEIACGTTCAEIVSTLIKYETSFRQMHYDIAVANAPILQDACAAVTNNLKLFQFFDYTESGKIICAANFTLFNAAPDSTFGNVCSETLIQIPQITFDSQGIPDSISNLSFTLAKNYYRSLGTVSSSSLSTTLTVSPSKAVESTGLYLMETSSADSFTASATITSTTSGLAIGDSWTTNTWYYLYMVASNDLATVLWMLTTSTSSIATKLPSGITLYRLMPCMLRTYTNSGTKIISFQTVGQNTFFKGFSMGLGAATTTTNITKILDDAATSDVWTNVAVTYAPSLAKSLLLRTICTPVATGTNDISFAYKIDDAEHYIFYRRGVGRTCFDQHLNYNGSANIQYRTTFADDYIDLHVLGFTLNEGDFI